jgi:hypothetical protein
MELLSWTYERCADVVFGVQNPLLVCGLWWLWIVYEIWLWIVDDRVGESGLSLLHDITTQRKQHSQHPTKTITSFSIKR